MSTTSVDEELIGKLDQMQHRLEKIQRWYVNSEERLCTGSRPEPQKSDRSLPVWVTLEMACFVHMDDVIHRLKKIDERLSSIEERLSTDFSIEHRTAIRLPLAAGTLVMAVLVLAGISTGIVYMLTR